MNIFESEHSKWFSDHLKRRSGDRKRRLQEGHDHAEKIFLEKVWFPAFEGFSNLHPEYEIADFKDGVRYLDFAYIRYPMRLAIEIDGFSSHASSISRWKFSDSLMRQNHLILDDWKILRFSYDDINEKPRFCQQLLQQCFGAWFSIDHEMKKDISIVETEVIKLAIRLNRNIYPSDLQLFLQLTKRRSLSALHTLVQKQYLLPAGKGTKRIRKYSLNPNTSRQYRRLF